MNKKQVSESIDKIMQSYYGEPYGYGGGLVSSPAQFGYGGNIGGGKKYKKRKPRGMGGCDGMYGAGRRITSQYVITLPPGDRPKIINRKLNKLAKDQGLRGQNKLKYKSDQLQLLVANGVITNAQANTMRDRSARGQYNFQNNLLPKLCDPDNGYLPYSTNEARRAFPKKNIDLI